MQNGEDAAALKRSDTFSESSQRKIVWLFCLLAAIRQREILAFWRGLIIGTCPWSLRLSENEAKTQKNCCPLLQPNGYSFLKML
jgi:hypothetical protein